MALSIQAKVASRTAHFENTMRPQVERMAKEAGGNKADDCNKQEMDQLMQSAGSRFVNLLRGRKMSTPGVEPGLSRPQRDVLTTRRCGL